ncbi:MAG: DUF1570 domain-containing protein [Phycisphaerae bacterium]
MNHVTITPSRRHRRAGVAMLTALWTGVVYAGPLAATQPGLSDVLPLDVPALRALRAEVGERFRVTQTPHFVIVSDSGADRVRQTRDTIEATYDRVRTFATAMGPVARRPPCKMTVLLFDTWAGYEGHARKIGFVVSESVPGAFDSRSNQCLMYNFAHSALIRQKRRELSAALAGGGVTGPAASRRRRRIEGLSRQIASYERLINATVVRHEIAHQVLANIGLQRPELGMRRWLTEGLAMQFESEGPVNRYRLEDLTSTETRRNPIEARSLITDPKRLGPGAERLPIAYATAWGLVRFLIDRRPRAFRDYLTGTGPAEPSGATEVRREAAAFEAAFGALDEAFESEFRGYTRELAASAAGH